MTEERPSPDQLLAQVQPDTPVSGRGKLTIFFGMCPGVGKTYAMLEAAHQRKKEGIDVVVGVVETHRRAETEELLDGLEQISLKQVEYKDVQLHEFDLDAVLVRRPTLVLVDELAHPNAPESRHVKRYQDVLELLDAGIDVYTTLNVQHVESRIEVVRQITGVDVHETVPDSILEQASQIQLIDLTPEQLRKRLEEGKVYLGDRAQKASENFFRLSNLVALREMALRFIAEHVDQDMQAMMRKQKIAGPWKTRERLLVGVGPSPFSESLVRWTKRIAGALDATWIAVHVDTNLSLSNEDQMRLNGNLQLVHHLGGQLIRTSAFSLEEGLLRVARENNVSQIVVGKPTRPLWKDWLQGGSWVDHLIRKSGDIDVYVVRPLKQENALQKSSPPSMATLNFQDYWKAIALVFAITLIGWITQDAIGYWSIALIYLSSVIGSALWLGRGAVLLNATLSALLWNFLFIPPRFTFWIHDIHDIFMFGMYFVVALVMGHLTSKLRQRAKIEQKLERRASTLYGLIQDIALTHDFQGGLKTALQKIESQMQVKTVLFLRSLSNELQINHETIGSFAPSEKEQNVAAWAFEHGKRAGRFTDTLPQAEATYFPLSTHVSKMGVLGILPARDSQLTIDELELLDSFATHIALMLERNHLLDAIQKAELAEVSNQFSKTLLDSISHELKTPLAIIASATHALPESFKNHELVTEIRKANARLQRIVNDLLDVTRIESGVVQPKWEWCDLSDLIQSSLESFEETTDKIHVHISDDMPLVQLDAALIEHILQNLVSNALKHGGDSPRVHIRVALEQQNLEISVADNGQGIPQGQEEVIFNKFHRNTRQTGSTGLGLTIARGFARVLGGNVTAANQPTGGAVFTLKLPVQTQAHLT